MWENAWGYNTGRPPQQIRMLLRAILDLHGSFHANEKEEEKKKEEEEKKLTAEDYELAGTTWLWRGQANISHAITPGIHSRLAPGFNDDSIVEATCELLKQAKTAGVNKHEGLELSGFALLAMLQHHGAATPLLDVSLDPLVALYMAVVGTSPTDDSEHGVLFAIKKPPKKPPSGSEAEAEGWKTTRIEPFDTRDFKTIYKSLHKEQTIMYTAPDVSERLRIQRGHFLLGKVIPEYNPDKHWCSIPLEYQTERLRKTDLYRWMKKRGKPGQPTEIEPDIAAFSVHQSLKPLIREWLEERTGLTSDYVYPNAWHRPHLGDWAVSHGRSTQL